MTMATPRHPDAHPRRKRRNEESPRSADVSAGQTPYNAIMTGAKKARGKSRSKSAAKKAPHERRWRP